MRDHGMFDFLMKGSESKSGTNLDVLKEFAKEASHAFMGSTKTPLNHTIQKTAKVESLTPDEISIVCTEANKTAHAEMFKTASNKYVDFEIADADVIVSTLEEKLSKTASVRGVHGAEVFMNEWETEKTASGSLDSDFNYAPSEVKKIAPDFDMVRQAGHDGLRTPQTHIDKVAAMKKVAEASAIKDEIIVLDNQIESAERNFVKEARNLLLEYPFNERPDKFAYIAKFCSVAGMPEASFNKMASLTEHVMKKQGLMEKFASLKADGQYISDDLDARVINGDHSMIVHIKTLADKEVRREHLKNKHNLIKTEMDEYATRDGSVNGAILGQKVKEL